MQPYRYGEPFGELEQVSLDDVRARIEEEFKKGADEVRIYSGENVIGYTVDSKNESIPCFNNRAGRRAIKFKNKKLRKE